MKKFILFRKNRKRKNLVLGAVALMALMLCGCGGGKAQGEKITVHVGYFPNVTHTQALVMKGSGSLEEALSLRRWRLFLPEISTSGISGRCLPSTQM